MQHKQLSNQGGLKKALFYAKVTTAVAVGAWLSFQPLVSHAQAKPPQEKTAGVQQGKMPFGGKTISFSDAQKSGQKASATGAVHQKREAIQVGGKQPPLQKFDSTHPYAGVRRILIELEAEPEKAQRLVRMYASAVDSIASIICGSHDLGPMDEAKIGRALVGILYPNVRLSAADTTLAASLTLNLYNCERLSMLEYDILGAIGIPSVVVALEDTYTPSDGRKGPQTIGHALIMTQRVIIDGVKDTVYAKEELFKNYRFAYGEFSGPDDLQYSTYFSLGNCMAMLGRHEQAIAYYEKAALLAPNNPFIFYNMGHEYSQAGELEKSLQAYDRVIAIAPAFADGFVPIIREVVHSTYIQKYRHVYTPDKK